MILGIYSTNVVRIISSPELHALQAEFHPSSSVGGLRLAHVFTHNDRDIVHHHLPKSEHDRRRLAGMYNMTDGCCSLETERDRVRTSAALNFHIYPVEDKNTFDEETQTDKLGRTELFDNGDVWFTWGSKNSTGAEKAEEYEFYGHKQDHLLHNYLLSDIDTSSWDTLYNPEEQYNKGARDATGVSMGVYEAIDGTQLFVFRGTYGDGDIKNIFRMTKDWVIEKTTDDIINSWEELGKNVTDEMENKSDDGLPEECLMRAGSTVYSYIGGYKLSNKVDDVSYDDIQKYGYWPLTKLMIRALLPADRDKTKDPSIYITGHSQGGARASLVSMWLEKEDGEKYRTYALAPVGVQCFSRSLSYLPGSSYGMDYLDDVNPYIFHDQITSYKHPLDIFARIDLQPGRVCHYGSSLLNTSRTGGSDLISYFERIVGFTGPMILIPTFNKIPPHDFAMTRYWSHSIMWMNLLFSQDEFLKDDGTTDGGCWDEDIVTEDDPDNICPTGESNSKCDAAFTGLLAFILAGVFVVFFSVLACIFRKRFYMC
jgi:hypothetical protein